MKEITDDYEHMNIDVDDENFVSHINRLKSGAMYSRDVEYSADSQIIVLQTCADRDNTYYILIGVKVEANL